MPDTPVGGAPIAATPLTRAVLEIDEYTAGLGWDQPARLFALVDTAALRALEPSLNDRLGSAGHPDEPPAGALTPVEQEELPAGEALDAFLATIGWPEEVAGCAVTLERLMLPPEAERHLPDALADGTDEEALAAWVAAHPERREVRITVGVLRDGSRETALRMRERDSATEVLTGPDLVPGLAEALSATFAD